jgi:putative ABC transport system ATP-binding protein
MLDSPTSGSYLFNGEEIAGKTESQRALLRKNNIGFVFQNFNLIDELTVQENVELPLHYLGFNKSDRKKKVQEVLEKIGIAHRAKHFPKQLSGGQQQRVAVSRAVVTAPKLILADEPTGNLDSHFGNEVLDLLRGLNEQGTTVIMVTHSKEDASYSRRIIELYDGQLLSENHLASNAL